MASIIICARGIIRFWDMTRVMVMVMIMVRGLSMSRIGQNWVRVKVIDMGQAR